MKQPNLNRLKIDRSATRKLRAALSKRDRVTITVNLDATSLHALNRLSTKAAIPSQRVLTSLLTAADEETIHARVNRLEQELRKIKRRFAA
jgi:hypothetical protein